MSIAFHSEQTEFEVSDTAKKRSFFTEMLSREEAQIGEIQFVFCYDAYLLEINEKYLQHNTLTDIITFPYSYDPVNCDIFISVERVRENAREFKQPFERELMRVMCHGVLHMLGYGDKSKPERRIMRSREDYWLSEAEKRGLFTPSS